MPTTSTITDLDIKRYLDTCNRLLTESTRTEDDRRMLALAERILANQLIGLHIYADDPDRACGKVTLRFADGRFVRAEGRFEQADVVWKISCDKILGVAGNPDDYLDHPEKQDWSCLISRLGLHPVPPAVLAGPEQAACATDSSAMCVTEIQQKYRELVAAIQHLQEGQSELVTSTKMSCLADFVSAVAHELNTPLGVINSSADSLRRAVDKLNAILETDEAGGVADSHSQRSRLLKIVQDNTAVTVEASARIADLVRRLKRFAHHDEAEYQPVDIVEGVEAALGLIEHKLNSGIVVHREFNAVPMIKGYPNKLNEMFLSILRNAVRAIGSTGRGGDIRITTASDEHTVYVTIADNGPGIPSEKRAHLFDFAFTKHRDRIGVQTGLASSFNIVRLHGGDIRVDSEEGKGTTVTITLPVG
ncbi:MAG: HAMP domain-containing sensor histidine kinase [candidate division Zixibacteria bacterium]|jgi:signal transduction histidine kinase|nr:HAMP domain-containing sensor histidine kinase [candidate division Zixibacteria bacterium]